MKNKKKIWIISFVCVGAGILIMMLGILLGGHPGFYFDSSGVHASGEIAEATYVEDKKDLDKFTSIEMNLSYADLEIVQSDKYAVEYRLEGSKKPVCTVENGKLVFKEAKMISYVDSYINFGFNVTTTGYSSDTYIKLYIPENVEFDTIQIKEEDGNMILPSLKANDMKITNEYGTVKIEGFSGNNMDIELQDGPLSVDKISAETAKIVNEYGEIKLGEFEGTKLTMALEDGQLSADKITADNMDADNGYGDIDIQNMKVKNFNSSMSDGTLTVNNLTGDAIDIKNEYGDVNLGLSGDMKDYDMDLTTEYGSIAVPGYQESNGSDGVKRKIENNSGRQIKIFCEDGDINLSAAK